MKDPPQPCFPTLVGLLIAFQRESFLSFPSGCSGHPLFLSSCWLSAELSAHLNQQHLLGAPQTSSGGCIPTQLCSSSAETQAEPILGRKEPSASIPADSKKQLWTVVVCKAVSAALGLAGIWRGCMCGSPQPPALVPRGTLRAEYSVCPCQRDLGAMGLQGGAPKLCGKWLQP